MLRRPARAAAEASDCGVEAGRVLDERAGDATSRRDFIARLSLATAATAAAQRRA